VLRPGSSAIALNAIAVPAPHMKADGHTAKDIAKYLGVSRAESPWFW
jgi:hypothetical protein